MTGILDQLRTVAKDLNKIGAKWALVGGLAVSVRSEPRTTKDIDLLVVSAPNDPTGGAESIVQRLEKLGYRNPQILMHMEPTHRLGIRVEVPEVSNDPIPIDILEQTCGIESEIVAAAEPIEIFPGIIVPVATLAHLLAMKVLSNNESDRLRDQVDIQQLLSNSTEPDLDETRAALDSIQQRGFSRGKELQKEFAKLLARFTRNHC